MTQHDPTDVIRKYLADLHALEVHGHSAIERQREQLGDSDYPDARRFVDDAVEVLERHMKQVESRLDALGEPATTPVQDAAATVTGVVAGLINAVRSEEAAKSLRDDYTFFSHVAIASLMLYTTSRALLDDGTARLAESIYKDSAQLVERVDQIMPELILHELRKDRFQVMDVAEDAQRMLRESWSTGTGTAPRPAASGARG